MSRREHPGHLAQSKFLNGPSRHGLEPYHDTRDPRRLSRQGAYPRYGGRVIGSPLLQPGKSMLKVVSKESKTFRGFCRSTTYEHTVSHFSNSSFAQSTALIE